MLANCDAYKNYFEAIMNEPFTHSKSGKTQAWIPLDQRKKIQTESPTVIKVHGQKLMLLLIFFFGGGEGGGGWRFDLIGAYSYMYVKYYSGFLEPNEIISRL